MKILILTDIHGQRRVLSSIDRHLKYSNYDGVFMLGDLCNRDDSNALQFANNFIDCIIKKHHLPLYCIHGNNEPDCVKLLYQQRDISVHFNPKKLVTYEVTNEVVGVGYGDAFPTDPQFARGKILLTHEPPRVATLRIMETINFPNAPIIHFAGHLHSTEKIWQLKNLLFVQVPTAMTYKAAVLQLPESIVSFIPLA